MTEEQKLEAVRLRATGISWENVAVAIGVPASRVRSHIDPGYKEYRQALEKRRRGEYRNDSFKIGHGVKRGDNWNMVIPPEVIADRDRRMAMDDQPQGIPLPGYSALDKRNG